MTQRGDRAARMAAMNQRKDKPLARHWPMSNDTAFDPTIERPRWPPGKGPAILLDGAHHNFFVSAELMQPFERLMRADGCRVSTGLSAWTPELLSGFEIVVVITALPFEFMEKTEVTHEVTFTAHEIQALRDWVEGGGSALIFSEHAPFDQAVGPLLQAFGVEASVGTTIDLLNTHSSGRMGWIVYSEANGLLDDDHAIVRGGHPEERVCQLVTFRGSALTGAGYDNILRLSEHAENVTDPTGIGPVGRGDSQALAGRVGQGKLLAFGDANGFTAMRVDMNGEAPFACGMTLENSDWKQFVLNAMHWLSEQ